MSASLQQPVPMRRAYSYPPGPKHGLVWFALHRFRPADPITLFQQLAREYGDVVHHQLGRQHILFLNDPALIAEVLVNQSDNFEKERTVRRSELLLGKGMITAEGAAHRRQRQAAAPAFHRQRIRSYAQAMVENARRTRENWHKGAVVDVSLAMMEMGLAIVAETLFGTTLGEEARQLAAAINTIMGMYNYMIVMPAAETLVHLPLPKVGTFKRSRARLDATVYRMMDEHRRRGPRDDLLSMLLEAFPDPKDRAYLRDQIITIFLAGYETIANALSWTWYLLSQNAEAEENFHAELDAQLAGRLPTEDDLPRLRYTEMVLAESMRLYPPAWAMGRRALRDFALGPYFLPARTTVLMSQYVLHRDPRYFHDPLRFNPERFTPQAKAARPRLAYFPFGAGPRQCIGESFAWMEGVLALATIGQRWKLRLMPGHRLEPQPLITLRPKYGVRMIIENRKQTDY
ncbi:MAG TPA: cytochrome P450 [Terriglobales bacterium]|jgi:cytochrome P450|nr:cytochrome P450 [Terriglobales bacterium]